MIQFKVVEPKKTVQSLKTKLNRAMLTAIKVAAIDLEQAVINKIQEVDAIDTGKMSKSIRSNVKKEAMKYVIEVYSKQPYWKYVEFGSRIGKFKKIKRKILGAKFPPIKKIRSWASRRLGITDKREIYLISRKIATEGIKGRPFLDLAYKQEKPLLVEKIRKETLKIMETL